MPQGAGASMLANFRVLAGRNLVELLPVVGVEKRLRKPTALWIEIHQPRLTTTEAWRR